MKFIWWEKTVEYLFVVRNIKQDILLAPLDGNYEAAGDVIASRNYRWVLIEFKRDKDAIHDEVAKFPEPAGGSFDEAKRKLGPKDGHHILVFGNKVVGTSLELEALTYFRHSEIKVTEILKNGVTQDEFNDYLTRFLRFKFGADKEGAGGRGLSYSTVVAINDKEEVTHCEGLASYCDRQALDLTPTQRSEKKPMQSSTLQNSKKLRQH